ncbi:MAG TPA: alpha/beta fold hydrolase, partial [Polyangiaceae bacterium]|nr:alpha/beta fold hydrolase [Polyangiaceae bacterium]
MGSSRSDSTVQGFRSSHDVRRVPFRAHDGMDLSLLHVQGPRTPHRGPVLLVHGAGVRANIFQAPVRTTIVDALLEEGYDVWLENWRASIDVKPNLWTLDQAALHDHPAAVRTVLQQAGAGSLDAVIHCQGSTSFMMSVLAGLVPQVKRVVSNAVSLHPIVPSWSSFKLNALVPVVRLFTNHLNPRWGLRTEGVASSFLTALTKLTHHECDNTVCRLVSFSYGAGTPALWSHDN